ncbi:hypothetical protein [Streptomyces sp. CBMA123]|uniref:hypothetical protein n=1 Tax=Streptomyces sp. CBMA123 TaxID=1896313 RepID=UPI001661F49B|nr:hypothetical protein [Streptomyces sp. CBMA123]
MSVPTPVTTPPHGLQRRSRQRVAAAECFTWYAPVPVAAPCVSADGLAVVLPFDASGPLTHAAPGAEDDVAVAIPDVAVARVHR